MQGLVADWDFDAVGGLTLGADPVATAMLHAAAAAGNGWTPSWCARRRRRGLQRRIEGSPVEGRRVVAVEDTSTTGGSVLTAVQALREAGAEVVGVAVIVDRNTGAREAIEAEVWPTGMPSRRRTSASAPPDCHSLSGLVDSQREPMSTAITVIIIILVIVVILALIGMSAYNASSSHAT